jgi:hypothetical protein
MPRPCFTYHDARMLRPPRSSRGALPLAYLSIARHTSFDVARKGEDPMFGKMFAAGVAVSLATFACGNASAEDRLEFCRDYARTAEHQVRRAHEMHCGLSGPRWTGEYRAHFDWCMGVHREQAEGEQHARHESLRACNAE